MSQSHDISLTRRIASPIFLVGFMGAGKTTVGRALAEHLECDFFDLDALIEANAGRSVQAIFSELGEAEFRRLEHEAIRDCGNRFRAVIALGGGAYVSAENRAFVRTMGQTIWLDCPLEICLRRISGDNSRPMLGGNKEMGELLEARRDAYAMADIVVQTGELSPDRLAEQIAQVIRSAKS